MGQLHGHHFHKDLPEIRLNDTFLHFDFHDREDGTLHL